MINDFTPPTSAIESLNLAVDEIISLSPEEYDRFFSNKTLVKYLERYRNDVKKIMDGDYKSMSYEESYRNCYYLSLCKYQYKCSVTSLIPFVIRQGLLKGLLENFKMNISNKEFVHRALMVQDISGFPLKTFTIDPNFKFKFYDIIKSTVLVGILYKNEIVAGFKAFFTNYEHSKDWINPESKLRKRDRQMYEEDMKNMNVFV